MKDYKVTIECKATISHKELYERVCNSYKDAINDMWETNGYWIDDFRTFDVADCIMSNHEVRLCVDNNVDLDTFYEWYCYDEQIHYGIDLSKPEARGISLEHWLKGIPEDKKVPQETRDAWEKEYWTSLSGD